MIIEEGLSENALLSPLGSVPKIPAFIFCKKGGGIGDGFMRYKSITHWSYRL